MHPLNAITPAPHPHLPHLSIILFITKSILIFETRSPSLSLLSSFPASFLASCLFLNPSLNILLYPSSQLIIYLNLRARPPGGGGGALRSRLRYQMATHCQTATRSGSGECQTLGAGNSFEGKKKGGGGQFQTKHLIKVVACKMCLFSLYFVKYLMFITL